MPPFLSWPFAVVLVAAGTWIALGNAAVFLGTIRGRTGSMIPGVGGALLAAGLALCPLPEVQRFWWFGPLLDPGGALLAATMLAALLAWLVRAAGRRLWPGARGPR